MTIDEELKDLRVLEAQAAKGAAPIVAKKVTPPEDGSKARDVADIRLRRLEERYADVDQVGFVAFMRGDGVLLDAGTHPVKYIKQS